MHATAFRSACAVVALALSVRGQGSDACTTAQSIAGYGSFPFSNVGQTTGTEGQTEFDCTHYGITGVYHDVWFDWTAPLTERVLVQTCGTTTLNTKMALYDGAGCPTASALWCNDDYCGQQSALVVDVVVGARYTLQLGSSNSSSTGGGAFMIGAAPADVLCSTAVGPDLIVGAMPGILNYSAAGGFDMISMGSTGCNVGSEIANWIDHSNDHPVIRENTHAFLVDGAGSRFEQIGMSWLKHGFGSEQNSTCCTCNPGGNFYHLGVGCSDTYNSAQAGSQPSLGPNWEVDAHTGTFPFPPANPPYSGAPARRCQMPMSSLAPSGATRRFTAEIQYVTKDDAAAGNQNNNASWIELDVTGNAVNYTFAYSGSIHTEESAIRAWQGFDPSVLLTDVQIPGDGLIVVGSRAGQVGGGTWHYEYALYNMNANRNVGGVTVPLPPGVHVTNVGFHDVAYHDGDGNGSANFSSTDWVATQTSSAITWSCDPESVDANANAIRWGTIYNFRFDADVPPELGNLSFAPWRTGAPSDLSAAAQVPSADSITAFCAGDGAGTPCPCGNAGAPGHGCENSFTTGGAQLSGVGSTSTSLDTLHFDVAGLATGSALSVLFFQGDASAGGGSGTVFGDGLRCAGGNVIRLGARTASGGAIGFGAGVAGDPAIGAAGAVPVGVVTVRAYQAWYRNAAAFCTTSSFNLSNGLRVVWMP